MLFDLFADAPRLCIRSAAALQQRLFRGDPLTLLLLKKGPKCLSKGKHPNSRCNLSVSRRFPDLASAQKQRDLC